MLLAGTPLLLNLNSKPSNLPRMAVTAGNASLETEALLNPEISNPHCNVPYEICNLESPVHMHLLCKDT